MINFTLKKLCFSALIIGVLIVLSVYNREIKEEQNMSSTLPRWDLSDFYKDINDPQIKSDLQIVAKICSDFENKYKGKLGTLSAKEFGQSLKSYEELQELIGKLFSFAYLVYATNVESPPHQALLKNIEEEVNIHTSKILFFALEINSLDDATLAKLHTDAVVAHYGSWLKDIRVWKKYQLSEKEESILHEKEITSRSAWVKLFDQIEAGLKFDFKGETVNISEILSKLGSTDEKNRELAAKALAKTLKENSSTIGFIYNTILKDQEIDDRKRGLEKPYSSRNISNLIEDEVVDSLVSTVKANYAPLSHRYYKIKAKMLGKETLNYWDRNAPLSQSRTTYSWEEAKQIVLKAYGAFSPELAKVAQMFFDNKWIDVPAQQGKMSGAFAHPTIPSVHPYLMLNYQNKARDVMTLAHEMGHGIHQYLARKNGVLMADTPLTLAETASVFGEQLTFRSLLAKETDAENKRLLIAGKIEDMLNTVVRQIAFFEFERKAHEARRLEGELSSERLNAIWIECQKESFGDSIKLDEDYGYFWYYVSHFFHSPFYVYSYAFGDCLVNSLYAVYQGKKIEDFEGKYLELLAAGGSKRYDELLKPFHLDPKDPKFWQGGLDKISELIDELEAINASK